MITDKKSLTVLDPRPTYINFKINKPMYIYLTGMIIALILAILLLYMEKNNNPQYGMIAPIAMLSWISVIMIVWKLGPKLYNYYLKK